MRILLWHGYLMRGSGSNIYTANVARSWRRAGHDVLVLCQERSVEGLDFVDAHGDFDPENAHWTVQETGTVQAGGSCHVVRPEIGRLLPVYVYDDYEGFLVKRFVDLTDAELSAYTVSNVAALTTAIQTFEPQAIVTGHEVMGPYIAKQACAATGSSYVAKLHGSALEYAVKEQARYREFAIEGLGAATRVVGGSNYMVAEASRHIPGWADKATVVNPGCDTDLFRPLTNAIAEGLPHVGFVGKLIAAKGVHNLIAAACLQSREVRLTIVGYGGFEGQLRGLAAALTERDHERAAGIARAGEEGPLDPVLEALESIDPARPTPLHVEFAGELDHGPLSKVLPTFDLLVVPSVVPEAFGMVAAEAAACGVLPLVPDHSGISEVGAAIEAAIDRPGLLTFDSTDPVRGIASGIERMLAIDPTERLALGATAVRLARERWSWDGVATRLLALATD